MPPAEHPAGRSHPPAGQRQSQVREGMAVTRCRHLNEHTSRCPSDRRRSAAETSKAECDPPGEPTKARRVLHVQDGPRHFERHSLIDAQRPDSLAAAGGFEPLNRGIRIAASLLSPLRCRQLWNIRARDARHHARAGTKAEISRRPLLS